MEVGIKRKPNSKISMIICLTGFMGCGKSSVGRKLSELLCIHRFYVGKTTTGIIQILTLGGLGIWTLIDLVLIIIGDFKDSEGNPVKP